MGDKLIETQAHDLALFHRHGLLPAFTGAMAEIAEHLSGLVQTQNQFTPILGEGCEFDEPPGGERRHSPPSPRP